jgi:hypothetical protein
VTALEQRHAELPFQPSDSIGYGSLGHAELAPCGGEARQPAGRLEDDEGARGGEEMAKASHKENLYKQSGFSNVTGT